MNCVSLAHLVINELFDFQLPSHLLFAELYLDKDHFRRVDDFNDLHLGDLVWFGLPDAARNPEDITLHYNAIGELINWREFPVKHGAIYTGRIALTKPLEAGVGSNRHYATLPFYRDPLPLHATQIDKTGTAIWPLSKFLKYQRYAKIYGVTRFILLDQESGGVFSGI